jgi:hypothetical protein
MDDRQFGYLTKLTTKKKRKNIGGVAIYPSNIPLRKKKRIPQVLVRRKDLTATCRCKVHLALK